jgi:hypothetical protein
MAALIGHAILLCVFGISFAAPHSSGFFYFRELKILNNSKFK